MLARSYITHIHCDSYTSQPIMKRERKPLREFNKWLLRICFYHSICRWYDVISYSTTTIYYIDGKSSLNVCAEWMNVTLCLFGSHPQDMYFGFFPPAEDKQSRVFSPPKKNKSIRDLHNWRGLCFDRQCVMRAVQANKLWKKDGIYNPRIKPIHCGFPSTAYVSTQSKSNL